MGRGGGQVRCEQRSEVFAMKIQKKKNLFFFLFFFFFFFFFFWGGGGGGQFWGQGRCEQRSEVCLKIQKKKIFLGGGGGGVRWGGPVGRGVRVDVNAILGVGGDVGYGRCEPRIEGIVQCTRGD